MTGWLVRNIFVTSDYHFGFRVLDDQDIFIEWLLPVFGHWIDCYGIWN